MCLGQGPQHSDAGEAWTCCPSVLSQALYHWATGLPDIPYDKTHSITLTMMSPGQWGLVWEHLWQVDYESYLGFKNEKAKYRKWWKYVFQKKKIAHVSLMTLCAWIDPLMNRVHTGLKYTWIYRTVLKSPWKLILPWKVLEKHSKALKSPWIFTFYRRIQRWLLKPKSLKISIKLWCLYLAAYAAPNKGTVILHWFSKTNIISNGL